MTQPPPPGTVLHPTIDAFIDQPQLPPDAVEALEAAGDEFDDAILGPQWRWHGTPCPSWHSLADRPGMVRLRAVATPDAFRGTPNLLLQPFPAGRFTAETLVHLAGTDPHAQAGLIVLGGDRHAAVALCNGPGVRQVCVIVDDQVKVRRRLDAGAAVLRVRVEPSGRCTFGVGRPGEAIVPIGESFHVAHLGPNDPPHLGLFCRSVADNTAPGRGGAYADVDYLRFGQWGLSPRRDCCSSVAE